MTEEQAPAVPEPLGARSTRTETVIRQFDADGKLTSETTSTYRVYVADDKPFPSDGYL